LVAAEVHTNKAQGQFPSDEFVRVNDVPIFAEHETHTSGGRPLKFGKDELELVAARCNQRIEETGDYAAITVGHTVEPGHGEQPPVVGFAGPFRVKMMGRPGKRKRYAIYCDLHLYKDKAEVLRSHPRRSPELWLEEKYEDMFLDPIALISEAPRLDMGLLYSALKNGRKVERYAACASAMSTFIPGHVEQRKYAADTNQGDAFMALSPEDIKSIVEAIQELDVFQWARGKMEEEQAETGEEAMPEEGAEAVGDPGLEPEGPPAEPPAEAPAAGMEGPPEGEAPVEAPGVEAPGAEEPMAAPEPAGDEIAPNAAGPAEEPENSEREKVKNYAAEGTVDGTKGVGTASVEGTKETASGAVEGDKKSYGAGARGSGLSAGAIADSARRVNDGMAASAQKAAGSTQVKVEKGGPPKLAKQAQHYAKPDDRLARLERELAKERYARVSAERRRVLEGLRHDYIFDPDEEMEFCGPDLMDDARFVRYAKSLEGKCERLPISGAGIPTQFLKDGVPPSEVSMPNEPPQSQSTRERYAKDCSDRALKYVLAKRLAGDATVQYEEVLGRLKRGEKLS
jgi:hypothetical protein